MALKFLLIVWKMQKPNQAPKRSVEWSISGVFWTAGAQIEQRLANREPKWGFNRSARSGCAPLWSLVALERTLEKRQDAALFGRLVLDRTFRAHAVFLRLAGVGQAFLRE